jgi:hypothetical protein
VLSARPLSCAALLYRDTNSAYYAFIPRSSDVLVAQVDFANDTVTSLAGQNSPLNGITYGYASGNLSFKANVFGGVANSGEFYLTGTNLTTHSGGASVLKYYFFNGQRVALRKDGMVYYLLGDHPSLSRGLPRQPSLDAHPHFRFATQTSEQVANENDERRQYQRSLFAIEFL